MGPFLETTSCHFSNPHLVPGWAGGGGGVFVDSCIIANMCMAMQGQNPPRSYLPGILGDHTVQF